MSLPAEELILRASSYPFDSRKVTFVRIKTMDLTDEPLAYRDLYDEQERRGYASPTVYDFLRLLSRHTLDEIADTSWVFLCHRPIQLCQAHRGRPGMFRPYMLRLQKGRHEDLIAVERTGGGRPIQNRATFMFRIPSS